MSISTKPKLDYTIYKYIRKYLNYSFKKNNIIENYNKIKGEERERQRMRKKKRERERIVNIL